MRIKYLIFVLLFCFSCNQQYKEENVAVAKIIQKGGEIELQKDKKVVLIVPVIGCSTCIEPVKNFINKGCSWFVRIFPLGNCLCFLTVVYS